LPAALFSVSRGNRREKVRLCLAEGARAATFVEVTNVAETVDAVLKQSKSSHWRPPA
jgi:hypothetical protein